MLALRRLFFLAAILAGAVAMTACPNQTTISKINQNPGKYQNRSVALVGTVTDSYGALGTGVYEVDDGTGRIWVMTTHGVPSKGSRVGVSGEVFTGLQYGGRNYGIGMKEEHRRTTSR
jgi:hypothetical protein